MSRLLRWLRYGKAPKEVRRTRTGAITPRIGDKVTIPSKSADSRSSVLEVEYVASDGTEVT